MVAIAQLVEPRIVIPVVVGSSPIIHPIFIIVIIHLSGRSAVWLAHLIWDQGVVSSNPTAPTIFYNKYLVKNIAFVAQPDRAPAF